MIALFAVKFAEQNQVVASCGDTCRRSGKATVAPQPTTLPISVQHDSYRADLSVSTLHLQP